MKGGHWLDVQDPLALLHDLLPILAGSAHVAFEGEHGALPLPAGLASSREGNGVLKRIAHANPDPDFLLVPLEPDTVERVLAFVDSIFADASRAERVWHITVAQHGVLQLGAYDNFHEDCVVAGPSIVTARLERLKAGGVLRGYADCT